MLLCVTTNTSTLVDPTTLDTTHAKYALHHVGPAGGIPRRRSFRLLQMTMVGE